MPVEGVCEHEECGGEKMMPGLLGLELQSRVSRLMETERGSTPRAMSAPNP